MLWVTIILRIKESLLLVPVEIWGQAYTQAFFQAGAHLFF